MTVSLKKRRGTQTFIKGSDLSLRTSKMMMIVLLLIFTMFPPHPFAKEGEEHAQIGKYKEKDEVIYANLNASGTLKQMYVVNSFAVTKPGEIIDYGNYSNIRNLTDLSEIEQTGNDEIHFQAEEDFYYQGKLENQPLPWNISITYELDGQKMKPEELAGESGDLEIHIETTANETVDPMFFNYYMLQISLVFDPLMFKEIQAPESTVANEGKNKRINFTLLPEQEEFFIISTEVTDFEMEPIEITAVPANLGFDDPNTDELASEMQQLADAIAVINDGVGELNDGVFNLRGGASTLSEGSNEFQRGMNELEGSSSELIQGSKEILTAFQMIDEGIAHAPGSPDLSELEALPENMRAIASNVREMNEAISGLEQVIEQIPNHPVTKEDIDSVYKELAKNSADERYSEIVAHLEDTYWVAQEIRKISEQIPVDLAQANEQIAAILDDIADGLENALNDVSLFDDLADLQTGLIEITSAYEMFHHGLVTYTEGVHTLTTSYSELNNGINEFENGLTELENGVQQLLDGTNELHEETSDLPEQFQSEIDTFLEDFDFTGYEPISFVSSENSRVNVVQFVLQTDRIEIEEMEKETEPEEKDAKKSIWQKFLDLFR